MGISELAVNVDWLILMAYQPNWDYFMPWGYGIAYVVYLNLCCF